MGVPTAQALKLGAPCLFHCMRADRSAGLLSAGLSATFSTHTPPFVVLLASRGIFEPRGVGEVHVAEGGVPFGYLKPRPVILHDRRFSPNNANVQWDGSIDTPSFFSVGVDKTLRKAVVVLHVLPVGDAPADRIREWIHGATTLRQLLELMKAHLPAEHAHVARMLRPLAGVAAGEHELQDARA